jgi:hypothetical protein
MKRLFITLTAVSAFSMFFTSCYYDNEEALYPTLSSSCDTINVTYSGTIVPILSNNCYSCHSNKTAATSGNNIPLENYTDVTSRIDAVAGSINHTGSFSSMPKNGGKLKVCSLTQFDIWIRKGMINN